MKTNKQLLYHMAKCEALKNKYSIGVKYHGCEFIVQYPIISLALLAMYFCLEGYGFAIFTLLQFIQI